jgi:uncharacterized protein (TIGR00255 family)
VPILSMTGFGAASVEETGLSVRAEIRSVNHRYLQIKARLPHDLAHLEPDVEELIRRRAERGAFTVTIHVQRLGAGAFRVRRDTALAYASALRELAAELHLAGELRLEHLLALPGVVEASSDGPRSEADKHVLAVVGQALDELRRMRASEGDALRRDLERNAVGLKKILAQIAERLPLVLALHHESLKRRVTELLGDRIPASQGDLAFELAILADRLDVGEELSRLASHLEQLHVLFAKDQPVGRQLDFLVQECLRELNTLGAKCNDATLAHWVVESKTLVERLREQVQNVE